MFARSPIKAGETVVIWSGTFVDREAAEGARADGKLIMQLDDNLYSVEERGEDPTYFMNHSCDPNVWMANAVTLVARRGIPSGAELTIDYALFEAVEDFEAEWELPMRLGALSQTVHWKRLEDSGASRAIRWALLAAHYQAHRRLTMNAIPSHHSPCTLSYGRPQHPVPRQCRVGQNGTEWNNSTENRGPAPNKPAQISYE